ncbi:MAG: hypothetical protein JWM47_767 [Acidimicrobiales bacterium]|nr:hypothetical protein [Acidimicrobiales bacterium]
MALALQRTFDAGRSTVDRKGCEHQRLSHDWRFGRSPCAWHGGGQVAPKRAPRLTRRFSNRPDVPQRRVSAFRHRRWSACRGHPHDRRNASGELFLFPSAIGPLNSAGIFSVAVVATSSLPGAVLTALSLVMSWRAKIQRSGIVCSHSSSNGVTTSPPSWERRRRDPQIASSGSWRPALHGRPTKDRRVSGTRAGQGGARADGSRPLSPARPARPTDDGGENRHDGSAEQCWAEVPAVAV